ncbi:ankyrin repeat domain-containing protein [Catellatospora sp. TT07R-123]|uniref:ankyrin repeat domain-containing protein n=1 Tax=Catellatospora sp. TT07R-123 TaxID=2733863 RepID=UPI001BB3F02B|nr:ankyrin repeat domain-containing protein [Catellatospora sp. TT07R-123]
MTDLDQALAEAVQAGDLAAAERALAGGADPDTLLSVFTGSVLEQAAGAGRTDLVSLLLDAGAATTPPGVRGRSPLRTAVVRSHPEVVRLLAARGAIGQEPTGRRSVLADALSLTSARPAPAAVATVRALLEAGAVPGPDDDPLLVQAVMCAAPPAVLRLLIEHGADVDQRRSDAAPVIAVAARRGDHAALDVLVQAGADIDARDAQGRTALMHAVERGAYEAATVLLTAGADAAAVDGDGATAVRLAQGWHRQRMQFTLGEDRAGLDRVPVVRTTIRLTSTGVRLAGDPRLLRLLAEVIDVALADLGEDGWEAHTGRQASTATAFATRLRDEPVADEHGSWHRLDATVAEFATARSSLVELVHGSTRTLPAGVTRVQLGDLLADLDRQLG